MYRVRWDLSRHLTYRLSRQLSRHLTYGMTCRLTRRLSRRLTCRVIYRMLMIVLRGVAFRNASTAAKDSGSNEFLAAAMLEAMDCALA